MRGRNDNILEMDIIHDGGFLVAYRVEHYGGCYCVVSESTPYMGKRDEIIHGQFFGRGAKQKAEKLCREEYAAHLARALPPESDDN